MTLTIPDEVMRGMTPEQVRLELAVALFAANQASTCRGAKIAGLNFLEFQKELGRRKIPIHYGVEDFEQDLHTLKNLPRS